MKRVIAALCVGALAVAGCGSSHVSSNQNVQRETTKAQAIIRKCLPNPLKLRTHDGRQQFFHCAVPPKNEKPFAQCVENVLTHGAPTKARLEHGSQACVERYA